MAELNRPRDMPTNDVGLAVASDDSNRRGLPRCSETLHPHQTGPRVASMKKRPPWRWINFVWVGGPVALKFRDERLQFFLR
jgi:hypothetical protein